MQQVISLPAIAKKVTLKQYVDAVKLAKQHPERQFKHTLETWWPGTGRDIQRQFLKGVHDRINCHLSRSGRKFSEDYQTRMKQIKGLGSRDQKREIQQLINF